MQYKSKGIYNTLAMNENRVYLTITKISTFEKNGIIKTVCIDRNNGTSKTVKNANVLRFKVVKDFMKSVPCLTVNYYHDNEYRYTCRTWSPCLKETKKIRKDF